MSTFKINLFTTLGCHLCEDALSMLQYYQEESGSHFMIELIEIAENEQLLDIYGVRIPVLQHSKTAQELAWPFNMEQLTKFLQSEV